MTTYDSAYDTMPRRMLGAARLDADAYETVEADTGATGQAATVVVAVAVAQAVGTTGLGIGAMVAASIAALAGWLVWSGVTYLIGDKLLGGTATWGELLRTLGFAQTPALLTVFAFLPLVGGVVRFGVSVWILIAGIVAIRQALDFGTGKAILTAVIGWLAIAIPMGLLGAAGF